MSDEVKVDPVDLFVSATFARQYAEDLNTACKAATTSAQASQSGWVGTSSKALGTLISNWEATAAKFNQTLTQHADSLQSSGQQYQATDNKTSNQIRSTSSDAQHPRLNLD